MDARQEELKKWLINSAHINQFDLEKLPNDASFRRYFRVKIQNQSYIAMDAPPAQENCTPFIAIAKSLRQIGLNTPEILATDLTNGFLLISDFGNKVYLKTLTQTNAEKLYETALDALLLLQTCQTVENWQIPSFTAKFMRQELELFKEWFLIKHVKLTVPSQLEKNLNGVFDFLVSSAIKQPQVFMHRDYHSANLMLLSNKQIGILDFQDAFVGPITYDLVSLLRDCYIAWPESLIAKLVSLFHEKLQLPISKDEFFRWFDLMGLQRHLKALLTFSRKWHRDGNPNYLMHIPRTLNYIIEISARYAECKPLYQFFSQKVLACVE